MPIPDDQQQRKTRSGFRSAMLLAVIGTCIGGADVAAAFSRLWLLVIPAFVIVADVAIFAFLEHLLRRGRLGLRGMRWWIVSQVDIFAVAFLCAAWSAAGGGFILAVLLGIVGAAIAMGGWRWRAAVFTAFARPGSSRLSVLLALVPALGAGGGGAGMDIGGTGNHIAFVVLVVVISLYLLFFAQAATIRISQPGWEPPPIPPRRKGAPHQRRSRRSVKDKA